MYDLRVVVEEVRGFCDLPMTPGDYFEVKGGRIIVPPGKHICLWALQSLMPILPAKQREIAEENDWIPRTTRICCPDPNGQVIYRIDRVDPRTGEPVDAGTGQGSGRLGQRGGEGSGPSGGAGARSVGRLRGAATGAAVMAGASIASDAEMPARVSSSSPARMLVNDRVCSGCRACELACAFAHEGFFGETYARVRVEKDEPAGLDSPRVCRQCGTARCVEACPKEALTRHPETHAVLVNDDLCTGCGLCAEACPFGAVHFHPETGRALICDLCGGNPACVERCATGALKFGNAGSYIAGPRTEGRG